MRTNKYLARQFTIIAATRRCGNVELWHAVWTATGLN